MRPEIKAGLKHIPLGFLVCILCYAHWALAAIFAASFLVYELNEDLHLSDKAYRDIRGFLIGVGIGGITMIILISRGIVARVW